MAMVLIWRLEKGRYKECSVCVFTGDSVWICDNKYTADTVAVEELCGKGCEKEESEK